MYVIALLKAHQWSNFKPEGKPWPNIFVQISN